MSENKWTPGPWEWRDGRLCKQGGGPLGFTYPDNAENRSLIAAAPDLAAACEQALATLEHHQADITYLGELRVVGDLRTALAKARGETTDG